MKRILSAVAVVAIVSSALAFAPTKGLNYCASLDQNDGCAVITNKTETPNTHTSAVYFKYQEWDGTQANCLTNRCATRTTLYNQQ